MTRSAPILAAIGVCLWMVGCGDDAPTTPRPAPSTPSATIEVDPAPDSNNAPWQLTGPVGYEHDGQGDDVITDLTPGTYTLTWGAISGWDSPSPASQTRTLADGDSWTVSGTYSTQPGTITVDAEPNSLDASWALTGPASFVHDGVGDETLPGLAPGDYTVTWQPEAGWDSPSPSTETRTLTLGAAVTFAGTYTTQVTEAVTQPARPVGPPVVDVGEVATMIYAMNATSNLGHSLEYRLDWGDGTITSWTTAGNETHAFASVGTYAVKSQARCATHTSVVSEWSDSSAVEVTTAAETVSTPMASVRATGRALRNWPVSANGAASSHGHALEFQYDFGDGLVSSWTHNSTLAYSWQTSGIYGCRVKARCALHTDIETEWSDADSIVITEAVVSPTSVSGPASGTAGEALTYIVNGGRSSDDHPLEYQLSVRDYQTGALVGTSVWSATSDVAWSFASAGHYMVYAKVRCALHTAIESEQSLSGREVTIAP